MFFYRESAGGPADPYFNNVSLLIKADGANDSTVFTDSSNNNLNITTYDGAKISTADSKYGGSSAYFDGDNDYIGVDSSDGLNFGAEDFTFEMWLKPDFTGSQKTLFAKRADGSTYGLLSYISRPNTETYSIIIYIPSSAPTWNFTPSFSIPAGEWTHIALVRNGNDWYYFVNGTQTIICDPLNNFHLTTCNFYCRMIESLSSKCELMGGYPLCNCHENKPSTTTAEPQF